MSKQEKAQPTSAIVAKAYSTFLDTKGVSARQGQKSMMNLCYGLVNSVEVNSDGKRTGKPAVAVIEAGTGTGKTLGYAIPLIPLSNAKGKTLILSTATVALQEQVMFKDLPDIRASAGLDFSFSMAKGRGRYYCKTRANREADREMIIYGYETEIGKTLRGEFDNKLWDGDRDTYPVEIKDDAWSRVNASAGQCTGQSCPFYASCPFYRARAELESSDVIVANHDIVLSDLALGGGAILPEPENCIYVFDEGHHLSGKALEHFSTSSSMEVCLKWLDELSELAMPLVDGYDDKMEDLIATLYSVSASLKKALLEIKDLMLRTLNFEEDYELRETCVFPAGQTPKSIIVSGKNILTLLRELKTTQGRMERIVDETKNKEMAEHKLITGEIGNRFDDLADAWSDFTNTSRVDKNGIPFARWVTVNRERNGEMSINTSPVHAGEMLRKKIWDKAHSVIITSATLRSMGQFTAFIDQTGLPENTRTLVAESPFDYENNGILYIPKMRFSPKEVEGHTKEIGQLLPSLVTRRAGCLVLFASKNQMTDVYNMMPHEIRDLILMQTTLPKGEIISRHKLRIDEGKQSIIFGMASFSEGVDLPGNYCNNVIIAKLPFMVPTDPVSRTLAGWMESVGRNTFEEISVPEAIIKLTQSVGRLIRTEEDTGAVTILDNRLVTKRYGRGILDSLPPFRRVIR